MQNAWTYLCNKHFLLWTFLHMAGLKHLQSYIGFTWVVQIPSPNMHWALRVNATLLFQEWTSYVIWMMLVRFLMATLYQNCWMVLYHHCLWIITQHHKNTGSSWWVGKIFIENGTEGLSSYNSTDTAAKYQKRWTGLLTYSVMDTPRATHNTKCEIQLH